MDNTPESITATLRQLRERAGLSMDALAHAMGYARASSIQRYEDPRQYAGGYLKRDLVAKLASALVGKGNPPITNEEVWELAGPEFRSVVSSYDPDVDFQDEDSGQPKPLEGGDVANLNIHGGLGLGSVETVERDHNGDIYADHVNGFWSFPPAVKAAWRNMPHVYSVPVTGDSMEPTLASGSYVFIDMTHTVPSPPDIYAIDYGDGLMIKRVELVPRTDKIRIISDNERYSTYELLREEVRVYGRVVAWFQWRG